MHGYDEDKAKVIARLRRIEGQVRAITQMVEDDKYCIDILTQISASNSALKSVALIAAGRSSEPLRAAGGGAGRRGGR